jgi:hypothetical protein
MPHVSRRWTSAFAIVFFVLLTSTPGVSGTPSTRENSAIELTFAFFGCNRIDGKDWEVTRKENPSSANLPQLRQNLTDIARLSPDYVFFGGDLVMGYADDSGENLQCQMKAWIGLVKSLPRSPKTRYVAVTGNHELNRKVGDLKLPNPAMDHIWSDLVKPAGLVPAKASGPTPKSSPKDNLITDQRALSFSFNRGTVHFAVLNTDTRVSIKDPLSGETKIGMVPVQWLSKDLDAAEKNPGVRCVVVMGHRNVIDPGSCHGDAPIDPECATPMVTVLKSHAKVRAYVCAHVHAFDIAEIGNSGLRQVVFGNGGSKLEKDWNPARGRTYGFGYFKAYTNGSLGVIPYLRPEPKDYMDTRPEQVPPASAEPELIIPVR